MARQFKRLATVLMTGSLAFGGVLVTGPQASATEHCQNRSPILLELDTPGENIDIEYTYCVEKVSGKFRARGYGKVMDGGGLRKVDAFKIESRLERNNRTVTKHVCDYTRAVNAGDTNADCASPRTSTRGSYTGDGRIYVNINNDGKGGRWYGVPGSVPIS